MDCANRLSHAVIIDRGESDGAGVDDAEFYAYDGNDQRVRRVTQRVVDASTGAVERVETVYLDGCELRRVVREDPETGAETLLVRKTSHIRFGEQRVVLVHRWEVDTLARETTSLDVARVHCQVGDHLGSATLELDETGALISYEAYFPFGGTAFIAGCLVPRNQPAGSAIHPGVGDGVLRAATGQAAGTRSATPTSCRCPSSPERGP